MTSYLDAKNIVMAVGAQHDLKTEMVPLEVAVGRVCASDLYAPMDIQPFDNSSMDGFAVRRCDLSPEGGVLRRSGMIAAGDPVPEAALAAGCCAEIMTGAPLPPAADAVVPIELMQVDGDQVRFAAQPELGAYIRYAGQDLQNGALVLSGGQKLQPQHVMPLAALGVDRLHVYAPIRAAFLSTGNELVENLAQPLQSGQIYNSNRPYGAAALRAMGMQTIDAPNVPDDPAQFEVLLKELMAQNLDVIISSGAVSVGKFDFVRQGLERIGADILFHRIKVKPGQPNLFARLPNGSLYFGLPGNPVSTTAGLRFLVEPALRAMTGQAEEMPITARAETGFQKPAGLRMFLKAHVRADARGGLVATLLDGQESFRVAPFLEMNCWALVPEDCTDINAGDLIGIYPLFDHAGLI